MKKTEMKPFKEMLLQLRVRMRGDVSTLANAALSKSGGAAAAAVQPFQVILPISEAIPTNKTTPFV